MRAYPEKETIYGSADTTILREADKGSVAEVARKHGISEQSICTWRKRFGAMKPADVKRLRHPYRPPFPSAARSAIPAARRVSQPGVSISFTLLQ